MQISEREVAWQQAAQAILQADALLIGAGAGMGVDSGLPDFRGQEGFWQAYPMHYGRAFHELANPVWFRTDPALAWGFYGHRLKLYQATVPHAGFVLLRQWAEKMPRGYFVFTSNVDGLFQKAGYEADRICECHGSIHYLQCTGPCQEATWPADAVTFTIEEKTLRAHGPLPRCHQCQEIARPNVLMFRDGQWVEDRSRAQGRRYLAWLEQVRGKKVVAIELGAGTAIPTVRYECERRATTLIRINPREAAVPTGGIGLASSALVALQRLQREMERIR